MKIDEGKSDATKALCEGDGQSRREFFNGLGKWSMIVVTAVSFLRGSAAGAQASREDSPSPELKPHRPAWSAQDDGNQRLAMHGNRHVNRHDNENWPYSRSAHVDHKIID